ncbi:MAG TPA: aminotransferase class III-fold pyridoxal phosphate-dependent enzyme [Myxococcota bacterium]
MSLAPLPTDRALTADEIVAASKQYTMYSWSAGDSVDPIPYVRAEGVWLWDANGKRYLDWNSQAMSVHIGHGNKKVIAAIAKQAETLAYVGAGGATEIRARLGEKLAKLMPGHLNSVFFTLGGGEANENAVRAARGVTGRQKVLVRYRSYHGATALAINMTGDQRRWANEPGPPGIVRVMDPQPYNYSFGDSLDEICKNNLQYLEETIMYEGGHTIACFVLETMTGTNGALPPPPGYLAGVRKLCDDNGILMICDEVMTGFGRTGKLFAFEHAGPDVVPDMITMAKGLSSSYLPLGAVGLSDQVAAYYKKNVFYGGHTYNSHPICLAAALANIEVIEEEGLVENAAKLEGVMREEMARLQAKHPCVKTTRATGLFGMIEVQKTSAGAPFSPYGKVGAEMSAFGRLLRDKGLITFIKASNFTCMPPLCISEAELREGFAIIDDALASLDAQMTS